LKRGTRFIINSAVCCTNMHYTSHWLQMQIALVLPMQSTAPGYVVSIEHRPSAVLRFVVRYVIRAFNVPSFVQILPDIQYSQSSLYEDSHYEISPIRTFVMKRIPSAWLVIRTRTASSEMFRTKSNMCTRKRKDVTSQIQWNQGKCMSQFTLRSALVCSL
jgi:hypothetical protein